MKNSEHLQWLHDRIINVYGESENIDFLIRFRKIIEDIKNVEDIRYLTKDVMEGPRCCENPKPTTEVNDMFESWKYCKNCDKDLI